MTRHGKKWSKERLERAHVRDEEASRRKPSEQISILDRRLGSGQGATRERARLAQLIREDLDFPPAKRLELIKNKNKAARQKEQEDETECQTNTSTSLKLSSPKPEKTSKKS